MAREVLSSVLAGEQTTTESTSHLIIHRAKLDGYRRYALKDAAYPAVIQEAGSHVEGTVAYGLSDEDVAKLDLFEGDEYQRIDVPVTDLETGEKVVSAGVYVWIDERGRLSEKEWQLDTFKKSGMAAWIESEMADLKQRKED